MGMAASQVRLLQLTARKNSIGWQLENLSMQKMALSRDMQKVTLNYQNALSSKTLKWSNNSGATYVDLSYANLMRPGSANQNKPYLITNSAGKVVIDNQYKKYAEMISPDGAAGGDYESNRTAILESLTGISADKIENGVNTSNTATAAEEKINTLQEEADILESKCTEKVYYDDFFKNCLGNIGSGFQWDGAASTNVGDVNFEVVLPNVQNYEDFRKQLIRDPNFEKATLTMVNNAVVGKSSLSKMRYV